MADAPGRPSTAPRSTRYSSPLREWRSPSAPVVEWRGSKFDNPLRSAPCALRSDGALLSMYRIRLSGIAVALLLAACDKPAPPPADTATPAPPAAPAPTPTVTAPAEFKVRVET